MVKFLPLMALEDLTGKKTSFVKDRVVEVIPPCRAVSGGLFLKWALPAFFCVRILEMVTAKPI